MGKVGRKPISEECKKASFLQRKITKALYSYISTRVREDKPFIEREDLLNIVIEHAKSSNPERYLITILSKMHSFGLIKWKLVGFGKEFSREFEIL